MLSRVAEHIYWMARYIERAEDTARVINVNAHLLLDLPRKLAFGWEPLIDICGNRALFEGLNDGPTERNIVKFMVGDMRNPGSIINSLDRARENARTVRDYIPREAWEQINQMYLQAKSQLAASLSQHRRFDYLRAIILGSQQLGGLLAGTMTNDAGYDFLRMGCYLERADMTTRIIDVRSANLLPEQPGDLTPFENIQWMSVLKSMTAYQMYRREVQGPVRRKKVLSFLFRDRYFPRAFNHCLCEVETCLQKLPRNDRPLQTVTRLQHRIAEANVGQLKQDELHEFIDDLQLALIELHNQIKDAYFLVSAPTETASTSAVA
jgi:uncharacterized alpha-E superfamily protein